MNQIIFPENNINNVTKYQKDINKRKRKYIALFIFSCLAFTIFIVYYIFQTFVISRKNKITQKILSNYDVQKLYISSANSIKTIEMPHVISETGKIVDIIGIIEIPKLNIRYPILSETTDEFLKIAPCKFYGPEINEFGNFCIAGHNFDNGDFFSNLYLLEKNDVIDIYSLNRW